MVIALSPNRLGLSPTTIQKEDKQVNDVRQDPYKTLKAPTSAGNLTQFYFVQHDIVALYHYARALLRSQDFRR